MKLGLRKVKSSDKKYFLKWWDDDYLIKMTSGRHESLENLKKFFKSLLQSTDQNFLILANQKPIGHIALVRKSKTVFRTPISIGESTYRGKGIGTWALAKILKKGFTQYASAYLEVRPENKQAIEVYRGLGYKKIGIKLYKRNAYQPKVVMMKLTKKDFEQALSRIDA